MHLYNSTCGECVFAVVDKYADMSTNAMFALTFQTTSS